MTDFQQGLKFPSEKCVVHFTEYLTNIFPSGNPRKEKKLKARILCFYMNFFRSKTIEQT